jgi:hypothetical protein
VIRGVQESILDGEILISDIKSMAFSAGREERPCGESAVLKSVVHSTAVPTPTPVVSQVAEGILARSRRQLNVTEPQRPEGQGILLPSREYPGSRRVGSGLCQLHLTV